MIPVLLTVLTVFAILVINEWWWHDRIHGEISRKFVHVTVGTFVAFWPLFLSWKTIELLSLTFIVVVAFSQKLQLFRAIHSVQRPTGGEIYFAISVGLIAFVTHNPAIYAVSLLHMSLADGLAAIVGVKFGASRAYHIFGATKSVHGTLAFLVVSAILVTMYALQQHTGFSPLLPLIVVGATLLENVAVRGLDNLVIPFYVAVLLSFI